MILAPINSRRINLNKIWLFIFLAFSSLSAVPQTVRIINLEEISQRKVRKYILERSIDKMSDFSSIHASCKKNIDESAFNVTEKTFYLKYKLPLVWECYSHANPVRIWNGRSVGFGLMISKHLKSATYANNSSFAEIDTGQVFFLNIRFLKGLFNIPVAFEIINIDKKMQIVEFSYIENNKSIGKQIMQFSDDGYGNTRIDHITYFKSSSNIRDGIFYPYFHKKFIREFHGNMRQIISDSHIAVSCVKYQGPIL
jgi:hypothetical protein